MNRLKQLNLDSNYIYGLHLDLSETKQMELFEDFLFSFLILKEYTQNEDIFCYQDNVHIKIEIPKGFYDFSEKFMILKLFKKTNLEKITKFQLLNESDKNFDDEEDIKKDKELYMNYKKNLTTKKTIRNTLDETMIPEDIQNIRKNHK